jgi:hypothetical protein
LGAQPSLQQLQEHLYVTRVTPTEQYPDIWQFDAIQRTYTEFVRLVDVGPTPSLSAREDRLVLQGPAFLEFDLFSRRLVSRYAALAAARDWAFHGVIVTPSLSATSTLPPGTYGFPVCPGYAGDAAGCGTPVLFPGYPAPTGKPLYDFIHRRSTRGDLELVKRLPTTGLLGDSRRVLSLDLSRQQFWVRHDGYFTSTQGFHRLNQIPIVNGMLGDEAILQEHLHTSGVENPFARSTVVQAFHQPTDSLYETFFYADGTLRFVKTAATTFHEEVLDHYPGAVPNAITSLQSPPPPRYTQMISAVANTNGKRGTHWKSELWMYNPSTLESVVQVRRVAMPEVQRMFVIPPRGSVRVPDVLVELRGGQIGIDALVIDAPYRWGEQLSVYSRTYTQSSRPGEEGGTYGQGVPAVPFPSGYSTHLPEFMLLRDVPATHAEFVLDRRDPQRFRHNIGVVNDEHEPLHVRLRYYWSIEQRPSRPELEQAFVVPPHSVRNINLETLFPQSVLDDLPPNLWVVADRPAPVWLSMVDNISGDATFLPYTLFGLRAGENRLAIPSLAYGNQEWHTDLYGNFVQEDEEPQRPMAHLYSDGCPDKHGIKRLTGPTGFPNNPTAPLSYSRRIFPDVIGQFTECTAQPGAIELPATSWMAAHVRTYFTREDGGTVGEMLPLYPAGGWPVQHFPIDTTQSDASLGLYNGTDQEESYDVTIYRQTGDLLTRQIVTLAPRATRSVPFELIGTDAPGVYGMTVKAQGSTGTWAFVTLTDKITGDPTNLW